MSLPVPAKITFEHHHSGLGIGCPAPRLSWRFISSADTVPGWQQTAYELELTRADTTLTYHVDSAESVLVPWPAEPLNSRESAVVRVRCFGKAGETSTPTESTWSPESTVEAALLSSQDWNANFITASQRVGPEGPLQPLRFRKCFSIPADFRDVARARLYITALGVFEPYLNGALVSDELLTPGWTSYFHRLNYRVLDVTKPLITNDDNVLAIQAAEGWYAGRLGFKGGTRFWYGGKDISILAQLEVTAEDGKIWTLSSDDTWSCESSPILQSEIYDGEVYDATKENPAWTIESEQQQASLTRVVPWPQAQMLAPDAPPVRVTDEIKPVELIRTPSNKLVVDFGQNLVGKVRVKSLQGPSGHRIQFKHAEVLEHGELGTRPLRFAACTDTVICNGSIIEEWTPRFTFHGFRYMQIDGWPEMAGKVTLQTFVALVMHTDMERTGYFECSSPDLNKLHQNALWSMRGNFLSIPTDCPQRDERLGWTGDIQVFAPSASYLYNTSSMLGEWCQDLAAEQLEPARNGVPPLVCPDVLPTNWPQEVPQAVWDDAVVLVPWVLYQYSGDAAILARQFPSIEAWLERGVQRGPDSLWDSSLWQLSDWLDPTAPPDDPGSSRTDGTLVADAYLVHVTDIVAQISQILQELDKVTHYRTQAATLLRAFQHKYITPYGNLMSSTQTAISLAVQFNLYPSPQAREVARSQLSKQVRYARFRIATGFAGTPAITHALLATGQPQLAYRMLLETGCPSWLYPVRMGATTIWERWNSMLPDGSVNPGEMTSFNHYALGSVVDFLHRSVGGIGFGAAGWRTVEVRPVPGGSVRSAKVAFCGPYGWVRCQWEWTADEKERDNFRMQIEVPPNCTARVRLPDQLQEMASPTVQEIKVVGSGVHTFRCIFRAGEWPPKSLKAINRPQEEDLSTLAV